MSEVIRLIPRSERERAHLIREARAIYDSIFPPAEPFSAQQDEAPAVPNISNPNIFRSNGALLP